MKGPHWLVLTLAWATALTTIRAQHYRIPCSHNRDCDHDRTHLSCLRNSGIKICDCRFGESFNGHECTGNVGSSCDPSSRRKCASGAHCKPDEYGSGVCECMPGYLENFELKTCEKIPENPYGHWCDRDIGDEFCRTATTGLKCLKVPQKDKYICSCRGKANFDPEALKCRLPVGSVCDVKSETNSNPVPCVHGANCVPTDQLSSVGICTEVVRLEVHSQTKEQLFNKTCKNEGECSAEKTWLKCLRPSGHPHKVCQCGYNAVFDETDQVCYLGVGNSCKLPSYYDRQPQKCLPGRTECRAGGESSFTGTCVCLQGQGCHEQTLPPRAESIQTLGSSSHFSFDYLFLFSLLLFHVLAVA